MISNKSGTFELPPSVPLGRCVPLSAMVDRPMPTGGSGVSRTRDSARTERGELERVKEMCFAARSHVACVRTVCTRASNRIITTFTRMTRDTFMNIHHDHVTTGLSRPSIV